jgi:hypothetical protein
MTAMRVIHTGPERRPQVVPAFEDSGVVDRTLREGSGAAEAGEARASATNSAQSLEV